ncbi:MAG: LysM peptidoglycan-binding domain-containing protein [Bacteroidales bacterium]|nr:LysM peptidoglycan-binding domain-containing protein [Bacteroidales bacterium]MCD8394926.1 LysM peptidoglycan-binding domain-containing protein [Bacteroidales bacterium]
MRHSLRTILAAAVVILTASVVALAQDSTTPTVTYKVKKGETVYGISKSHGITVDQLIQYNPTARDGVRAGEYLVIPTTQPVETTEETTPTKLDRRRTYHTIAQGETLYSIGKRYGLTVEQIQALNPGLDTANYRVGAVLRLNARTALPSEQSAKKTTATTTKKTSTTTAKTTLAVAEPVTQQPVVEESGEKIVVGSAAYTTDPTPMVDDPALIEERPLAIGIILPFMTNESRPDKSAQLYTEFLRGFLLAADTLSHRGAPVAIRVYDSHNSLDTVRAIMQRPEIAELSVIVAPDDTLQLAAVAEEARRDATYVYNAFAIKDESHRANPYILQANIPHDEMYQSAIEGFIDRFGDYIPVFITHSSGKNEKSEFTNALREALDAAQRPYRQIEYANYLSTTDLKSLPTDSSLVFIPASAQRSDFNKYISALKTLREESVDPTRVRLFGYPEWVMFRGDALDNMGLLNTVIYSRFYNDTQSYDAIRLANNYRRWYGADMMEAVPSQGVLGFDTGCFLIRALRDNDGDLSRRLAPYDGVQSAFDFETGEDEDEGQVNGTLYFVYFRPGGVVEKTRL